MFAMLLPDAGPEFTLPANELPEPATLTNDATFLLL